MPTPDFVPDFRAHLAAGPLVGTWITIGDPAVAEIIAGSGVDFVAIDGEHGTIELGSVSPILATLRSNGIPALFRVAENEQARIQHALDAGASGVIVPRIRSAADAVRAADATRYPPVGTRGIAPRRANAYGRDPGYLGRANDHVACVIQIETREALADLDAILRVPRVDGYLVGPNDLAASLGHTGELDHPENLSAIAEVLERGTAAGIPVGIHVPDAASARRRLAEGFRFTTVAADFDILARAVDAMVADARG